MCFFLSKTIFTAGMNMNVLALLDQVYNFILCVVILDQLLFH